MRSLLLKNDQSVSASNTLQSFLLNASYPVAHAGPSFESEGKQVFLQGYNFGDSMYLFGDATKTLQEQADWLLGKCSTLIAWGLNLFVTTNMRDGFLVRVGIASGDLRMRWVVREPDKVQIETRIGTAMMKAQCLQEPQQWIGGAIEASIPRNEHSIYRVSYPVPWNEKKDKVEFPVDAINWVRLGIDNPGATFFPPIEKIETAAVSATAAAEEKWSNTLAFMKEIFRRTSPVQ